MTETKFCKDCSKYRKRDDFYACKHSSDGKDFYCKFCRKIRRDNRKDKLKDYMVSYRRNNRKKRIEYCRKYNKENKAYFSNWRELNKDKCRFYHRNYQTRKRNATPRWLSEEHLQQIESFYSHARDCEVVTGEKYHVDHIIPLQGKNICGLHVPWNLQVLPADVNIRKSNRVANG